MEILVGGARRCHIARMASIGWTRRVISGMRYATTGGAFRQSSSHVGRLPVLQQSHGHRHAATLLLRGSFGRPSRCVSCFREDGVALCTCVEDRTDGDDPPRG